MRWKQVLIYKSPFFFVDRRVTRAVLKLQSMDNVLTLFQFKPIPYQPIYNSHLPRPFFLNSTFRPSPNPCKTSYLSPQHYFLSADVYITSSSPLLTQHNNSSTSAAIRNLISLTSTLFSVRRRVQHRSRNRVYLPYQLIFLFVRHSPPLILMLLSTAASYHKFYPNSFYWQLTCTFNRTNAVRP